MGSLRLQVELVRRSIEAELMMDTTVNRQTAHEKCPRHVHDLKPAAGITAQVSVGQSQEISETWMAFTKVGHIELLVIARRSMLPVLLLVQIAHTKVKTCGK